MASEPIPGYWSVMVAGVASRTTRYWQVGVVAHGDPAHGGTSTGRRQPSYVATSLPAEVARPATAKAEQLAYSSTVEGATGVVGKTVEGFFNAYLTGAEIDRYLAPGTRLQAPSATRYTRVRVVQVAAKGNVGADGEWLLFWTDRGVEVPAGFSDLLDRWVDIDARERRLDIERGTPILVDPAARVDPRLVRFLGRSRFAWLAEGTRQSYAKDYRLFFSFLWQRGRYWDEASSDDVDGYEWWRRRSGENPRRIGGAKWARELAALKLLYDWATGRGHVVRSPVATHRVRRSDGSTVEVPDHRPKDVRSSKVKWVTPLTAACDLSRGQGR